ncbi:MAG: TonB-dependent receptor [Bacteroidetes bacterium]|nr:TonB-dependent receptor [Bacteroidota bacterium]
MTDISLLNSNRKNAAIFFFLLVFSFLQTETTAQENGIVKGVIIDAASGSALPGASVLVIGTQLGTSTNENGSYKLTLAPGKYTLQASYIGYKFVTIKVTVESGKTIVHNFNLAADLIGTQEIVIVGTRTKDRTVVNSPVPIDVITARDIEKTGVTDVTQLLKMLVPSYNAPENTITDGSDHVRPATLRGLGPDQVLVLINGKRLHTSALLHLNGSVGRGSTGADLNTIPTSSIERIEVLRDGASAQYGSDAISGVINIILKDKTGLDASASIGEYATTQQRGYLESEGNIAGENSSTYSWDGQVNKVNITDGLSKDVHLGYGFNVNQDGTVYISTEYRKNNYTNRAGLDPRQQYFTINGQPDPREASFDRLNHRYGDADLEDFSGFLNSSIPLSSDTRFYAFGGYTYRSGLSGGFYRRALDDRTVRAIYPDGYLPYIQTKIYDGTFTAGLKGMIGSWNYDASETYGGNTFNFNTTNTVNASMGTASPTSFDDGDLKFLQSTTNLDFLKLFDIGTSEPLSVAAGLEFRWENYQITPGEYSSYADGGVKILDGPDSGKAASPGSQVFPGFSPTDAQNHSRTNFGIYVDLENNITHAWTLGVAGRFENYNDFGSTITGKINTRYELFDGIALRGAISNGFRAPSLAQEYFSSIATVFINGVPYEVGTFPVSSPVAKALGAKDLTAEKSLNYSAGITYSKNNFVITVDGYQIDVTNRIVLTENFTGGKIPAFLASKGINANGGRFFTNALNTSTKGVDVTGKYGIQLAKESILRFIVAMNFNKTDITNRGDINTPAELQAVTSIPLYGRVAQGQIERGTPLSSWNFSADYSYHSWDGVLSVIRYGQFTTFSNNYLMDQTFNPVWVTNLELSYTFSNGLNLAVGSNNLFDVYPDKALKVNSFNGIFPYSSFAPSGFNGRFIFMQASISM